ncbi:unnamed protein product [Brugia pahangi]|uniref:DUF3330 domain-containing protein n=1 Tax=Brugia pahangi TaxID=6280 RepID=A0A0N4T0A1_BRUPA|nr:unnamed protein product [Brugia pahangi]
MSKTNQTKAKKDDNMAKSIEFKGYSIGEIMSIADRCGNSNIWHFSPFRLPPSPQYRSHTSAVPNECDDR